MRASELIELLQKYKHDPIIYIAEPPANTGLTVLDKHDRYVYEVVILERPSDDTT